MCSYYTSMYSCMMDRLQNHTNCSDAVTTIILEVVYRFAVPFMSDYNCSIIITPSPPGSFCYLLIPLTANTSERESKIVMPVSIGYSKENLMIHTGSPSLLPSPTFLSLPSFSSPFSHLTLLSHPSLLPFLPVRFSLEVGLQSAYKFKYKLVWVFHLITLLNAARFGERCKLPQWGLG